MVKIGTIKGSALGPILQAIYALLLFDLTPKARFADDNSAITDMLTNDHNMAKRFAFEVKKAQTKYMHYTGQTNVM